jgi:DNA-binding LytR/AlgR family response regulator
MELLWVKRGDVLLLRIAVCDDDNMTINMMEDHIDKIGYHNIDYDSFSSGNKLLEYRKRNQTNYDVYFLDIEMPGSNGLETAKLIREEDTKAIIIFITSHTEYMEQAFEVQAFRFLKKPITRDKLITILKDIENYLNEAKTKLFFQYDKEYYNLNCDKIVSIEKVKRLLLIHMADGEIYKCNLTVNEIFGNLNKRVFAKSYPSVIVNMEFVKIVKKDTIILDDKSELPLSRRNKIEFKQAYMRYVKERMSH